MTRIVRWLAVGAALVSLAACGQGQQGGDGAGKGGGKQGLVNRGDIRIVMVTHGPPSDPFWSIAKNGADQAAKDLGVKFEYRAPSSFDVVEIQQIMESAIATKPDGLAVTIADTDALAPVVKKATDEGIPVIVLNAGRDVWQDVGALTYVGQTEFEAGVEAGKRMAAAGVTNALCVNHQQGVVTLDQRCDGFAKGLGGAVKQVAVDGSNPTAAQSGIQAALRNNADANGMLTLGPAGADPALKALESAGRQVRFGTFDLSPEILQAVSDGKVLFAIDQQQWLQGYLPVFYLTQYLQYGVTPVGETPTGPAFVTKDNAADVVKLSKEGIR